MKYWVSFSATAAGRRYLQEVLCTGRYPRERERETRENERERERKIGTGVFYTPRGVKRGWRKREGDERNKTRAERDRGKRDVRRQKGEEDRRGGGGGTTEATKGRKGEGAGRKRAARVAAGRRYFRKLRRSAARAAGTQETRNALSRTTVTEEVRRRQRRSIPVVAIGKRAEDAGEARNRQRRDRHAPRIRRGSGVGLPTSRHSPVPWTVLYLPLSMTLYTGPFRSLSVRRNTGFYQLLRRAPITGKL